jgi:hypothetical protein
MEGLIMNVSAIAGNTYQSVMDSASEKTADSDKDISGEKK